MSSAGGHIPGANQQLIAALFSETDPRRLDPDGTYVIYCQRGARQPPASGKLMPGKPGSAKVYEVEGGHKRLEGGRRSRWLRQ